MSIELSERTIAFWYLSIDATTDYIGHLETSAENDNTLVFTYRFRYYDPTYPENDPWSQRDTKNWYQATITNENKEQTLSKIRTVINFLELASGNKADEILGNGDVNELYEKISAFPWAHMRHVAKESFKGEFN